MNRHTLIIVSFVVVVVVAVSGCSHHSVRGADRYVASQVSDQYYDSKPHIIYEDYNKATNQMIKAYGSSDFEYIYKLLKGYLSAGEKIFIAELIANHAGMSVRFAAVALDKNDEELFQSILAIATANERDSKSLQMLTAMQQVRDSCSYKTSEAIRVYFREGRDVSSVRPLLHHCPQLNSIF